MEVNEFCEYVLYRLDFGGFPVSEDEVRRIEEAFKDCEAEAFEVEPDDWLSDVPSAGSAESWYSSYVRDFFTTSREFDDWLTRYRRDFVPDRSGRVFKKVKAVPQRRVDVLLADMVLVGRGHRTNNKCGGYRGMIGCLQHEKHKDGMVFWSPYFNSCDKPSCPICYRSWAVREGFENIAPRLAEASKLFGLPPEHAVLSLPKSDYDLPYKEAKRRAIEIFGRCGVFGGVLMPHGNRIDKRTWVESFSPHFHALAFVEGCYERCRRCKGGDCYACDGVEGRCYRVYKETGYIVKVMPEERKSVGGTAYYELSHSSMDVLTRRFRVAVWFGRCGYRNLGVKAQKPKMLCPECGSQVGFVDYVGKRQLVIDKKSPDFKRRNFDPFLEDGESAWVVREFQRGDVDE